MVSTMGMMSSNLLLTVEVEETTCHEDDCDKDGISALSTPKMLGADTQFVYAENVDGWTVQFESDSIDIKDIEESKLIYISLC